MGIFVKVLMAVVVVLAGVMLVVGMAGARAEELTDEQEGRISMGCGGIKVQLRTLQKADSRMRVYLGSKYEIVLSNFMTNLNLRLIKNNLATENLTGLQTTFSNERERFKADFTGYSQALDELINVDCQSEPQEFYDQLVVARKKRAEVQASYYRMNEVMGWHVESVEKLRGEL
jgi:hypothetical protein